MCSAHVDRESTPKKIDLGMDETIEGLDESKIEGTDPGSLVI